MQMMTMTRLMRVLIDVTLLLGLCLIGAGAYFTYGLGPALLLVGGLLLGLALLAFLVILKRWGDRHARDVARE